MKLSRLKKEDFVAEARISADAELSYALQVGFKQLGTIEKALTSYVKSLREKFAEKDLNEWDLKELTFEHNQSVEMSNHISSIRSQAYLMLLDFAEFQKAKLNDK